MEEENEQRRKGATASNTIEKEKIVQKLNSKKEFCERIFKDNNSGSRYRYGF